LKCWIWIHNTHKEKFNFLSSFLLPFSPQCRIFFFFLRIFDPHARPLKDLFAGYLRITFNYIFVSRNSTYSAENKLGGLFFKVLLMVAITII